MTADQNEYAISVRTMILATCCIYILCILPLLFVHTPPLHDYPFHIARMVILTDWNESSILQSYYHLGSFILPNIAMDAVVVFLSGFMPVETSGRVFIALTIALQLSGCVALHYSLYRKFSVWPLVSALFVFNWIFLFGFLNYLFGVGLVLWASALWIVTAKRSVVLSILCGSILSLALFFCHLIACGLFAVIVAGYEISRAIHIFRLGGHNAPQVAIGRLAAGASIFILPIFLFLHSSTVEGGSHFVSHKMINLLRTPFIFLRILLSGHWTIDLTTIFFVVCGLGVILFAGKINVKRSMRITLILLVLTFLLMPHELFGGWGADSRIPVLIIFVLIASTRPMIQSPRLRRLGFVALVLFVACRSALMTYEWQVYDRVYDQFRTAFKMLPPHSILFTASESEVPSLQDFDLRLWHPPIPHAASLAVLENPEVFVTLNWATAGQQPIVPTAEYLPLYLYQNNKPVRVTNAQDISGLVTEINTLTRPLYTPVYLLLLYPQLLNIVLPANVKVIASGTDFLLLSL